MPTSSRSFQYPQGMICVSYDGLLHGNGGTPGCASPTVVAAPANKRDDVGDVLQCTTRVISPSASWGRHLPFLGRLWCALSLPPLKGEVARSAGGVRGTMWASSPTTILSHMLLKQLCKKTAFFFCLFFVAQAVDTTLYCQFPAIQAQFLNM